jgi:hypothetical protein
MVATLRATARPVYAINPLAMARYRERHSVARAKADHADAMTLANILRVDAHQHRALPADSELCQAIAVQARAVPAIAPTPAAAAKLSTSRIAAALRRAGRSRGIDQAAAEIQAALRKPQLRQPVLVETAMGKQALALLAALDTACASVGSLGQAAESFQQHPDYATITSFPGLADSTGARVLAEIGDDRTRFADARALKAYAGSAPITRASARSICITHRHIKNSRLAAAGWIWAFAAATNCPAARQRYQRRREHGDRHGAATRHLFNKLLGQLYHCLQHQQTFDEAKAFPLQPRDAAA